MHDLLQYGSKRHRYNILGFSNFLGWRGSPCSVVGQISVTFASLISFVGQIYLFLCSSCQGRKKDFSSCKEALAVLGV